MIKKWAIGFFSLFFRKANNSRPKQHIAELLARNYLDNFNRQSKYDILEFSDFHSVITNDQDDSNIKSQIQGWVITVIYNGRNEEGVIGKHKYLVAFDAELSKVITGIETTSVNIHI
jgi:hypothetical protein